MIEIVTVEEQAVIVATEVQREFIAPELPVAYIVSGQQGPPGPPGAQGPAGGTTIPVISDVAIGGHRMVYLDAAQNAQYASNQIAAHANKVLGLTTGATNAGDEMNVLRVGEMTEGTWNWTLDQPVYLATNGLLTQTPPDAPAVFSLIVGFPVAATKLFVSIREPIFKE